MKHFLIIALFFLSMSSFAQLSGKNEGLTKEVKEERLALTVGLFQGGGSLIGFDFELMVGTNFGIQLGTGYVGIGAAVNYHFKPSIRSSFISLLYWHQGLGFDYTQSLLGPSFTFRGKKWLTFNLGLGFPIEKGPAWPSSRSQGPVQLTFGIGGYFPL